MFLIFQIVSYPRKIWRKKNYQYLKFFLAPKRPVGVPGVPGAAGPGGPGGVYDPDMAEMHMHTITHMENPGGGVPAGVGAPGGPASAAAMMMAGEDSNSSDKVRLSNVRLLAS